MAVSVKVLTVPGEDAFVSSTGSWDVAMEARKSSTCLRDRELWRVSKGQIEGTMEYNSKPSMKYTRISESDEKDYTGAGHIIRISSKSLFISLIPFKMWNLYNVYIHSTQTDIFQVFISLNFDDYNWQLMKTPNSVSQKIWILWKGSILKTPGATL